MKPHGKLVAVCQLLVTHLDIEECGYCSGSGKAYDIWDSPLSDACPNCGGVGEVVKGDILPSELRAMLAALRESR